MIDLNKLTKKELIDKLEKTQSLIDALAHKDADARTFIDDLELAKLTMESAQGDIEELRTVLAHYIESGIDCKEFIKYVCEALDQVGSNLYRHYKS